MSCEAPHGTAPRCRRQNSFHPLSQLSYKLRSILLLGPGVGGGGGRIGCGVLLAQWAALLGEVPVPLAVVTQPTGSACIFAAQMAGACAAYSATQKQSYPFAALTVEFSVLMFSQDLTLFLYLL